LLEEFREINVGILDGRSDSESWDRYFEIISKWDKGEKYVEFPEGENYISLSTRFSDGLIKVTNENKNRKIIVVGHGGIFVLAKGIFTNAREFDGLLLPNCSITKIVSESKGNDFSGIITQWASTSHLSQNAAKIISGLP
jgi:probable phosphoglycerate mutase